MRALVVVVLFGSLAACAAVESPRIVGSEPTVVWDESASAAAPAKVAPMSLDEARSIALAHDAAHTCEITARALHARDRQRGWAVMQQCVLRPDFTDLETLIQAPWIDDLREQAEYATLVGHVIAERGGDVQNDLRLCRRARLPVFSLRAALAEPQAYKGKLVLMRGQPQGGRNVGGARSLDIAETKVMAEGGFVPVGPRTTTTTETDTADRTNNSIKPSFSERLRRDEGLHVEVLHNVSVETGLELVANVEGDAPFLESGTDYVLVLRFDGTRTVVEGTGTAEQPVATVVGYFEPESGLFARLGR